MDLWHGHAIRWRFSCSQRKKLATCHFRLSRLGVAPCTIGMSTSILAGNPCFSRQSSCDVISRDLFLCDSSLFSVERINEKKFSFFQSHIKLQTFFSPHVKNESIQRTGSYEKSSSKILLLVAVALWLTFPRFSAAASRRQHRSHRSLVQAACLCR